MAKVHLEMGTGFLADGHIPQAFKELMTAESLDPTNPIVYNNLGIAYTLRKKYKKAQTHFEKAIQLQPNYTDAINNLGHLHCKIKQTKKCIQLLLRAQKDLTYTNPERVLSNLGQAYFQDGQFHLAKEKLRDSLEINKKQCLAYYYYARTHYSLEDYEQAASLFDRAIKLCLNNKFEEPRYYSGLSYLKLGNLEMAKAKFEEVIHHAPLDEYATRSKKMLKLLAKAKVK